MISAIGYAAKNSHSNLKPLAFKRSLPKANEVQIKIEYCGVCHSDVHQVKNEWKNTVYPCMPGHEILGRVEAIGSEVSRFQIGELVGVGCMVDSCHQCDACKTGLENYCEKGFLATYNGNMRTPSEENNTFGGYSNCIVVREDFVLSIPSGMTGPEVAPILCAGITTYSPLKYWKVGPGTKVGIVGFGGLGHMATKIAHAMGAEVTVITSSVEKKSDALQAGAKKVVVSKNQREMEAEATTLDFILNTIPQPHDLNPFMKLLKREGTLTVVGCIAPTAKPVDLSQMITDRKKIGTSLIGGIAETQEVLNFCSKHDIRANVKLITVDQINDAYAEVDKGNADFRYVIDMSSLTGKHEETLLEKLHLKMN